MRIVHLSDTHMFHRQLDVPAGDVFVNSGDLASEGTLDDYVDVFNWFDAMPHAHKVLIAGNRDSLFQHFAKLIRKRIPTTVIYLEDSGTTINGVKFWGSPWTPGYPWMAFTYHAIEGTEPIWSSVPSDTDVLVTHGPPHGVLDLDNRGQHIGDRALLERVTIVRPRLHLFGHVHDQNGRTERNGITFVNAAIGDERDDPDPSGKIRVLDV
jgi:Icc-related predicted phosphoesterase